MPSDPSYQTPQWKALRASCIQRDHGRCVACGERGLIADHIIPRKRGGPDNLANLRTLCRRCDNQRHADKAGIPRKVAVGVDGWPKT